ncbi:alpha/beta hydrolase family protein [Shewanella sp. D64]|uniref:DUF3530 family protein n=1 Tax=unclassified Shewanella TaxID=196818 RepID=UPI0022BA1E12|nr:MULTISPECIES: DUF3530 family protein [unclassified Shewanella]MEC4725532.1 alpha/beta hydrolase family protein [Shewanella sp. D64]MEC4738649.1 alpha/beta hydrolase family protein [Shewanella sp. E94]WBJ94948.1 alpha/beta hydrolase family protein [Shewanella sp. MTB7]
MKVSQALHFLSQSSFLIGTLLLVVISTRSLAAEQVTSHPKYSYLASEEVISIEVGKQKSEVLVRSWTGKKKLGAAILFSNPGMNADSAGLQAYLRRELPHTGWATIAITPPKRVSTLNFATAPGDISKPGEGKYNPNNGERTPQYSKEQWINIREKQETFIADTMNQLDEIGTPYPGKRILIATGQGAGFVISMLSKNRLTKPDVLVLINPFMSTKHENLELPKLLAELDIPVLDIQSADGHIASQETKENRRLLSPQNAPYRYRQQRMLLNLNQTEAWQTCLDLIEGFAHSINKTKLAR